MKSPRILTGDAADIFLQMKDDHHQTRVQIPEAFQDERFSHLELNSGKTWTLKEQATIVGRTTFLPEEVSISLLPLNEGEKAYLSLNGNRIPYRIENIRKGIAHCLQLSDGKSPGVEIVEHLYSLLGILRLEVGVKITADQKSSLRNWLIKKATGLGVSLPSFAECNGPFLEAIHAAGVSERSKVLPQASIDQALVMGFPKGGYIALQPHAQGEPGKILKNRIHYSDIPSIGSQEMSMVVEPSSYAYLATARPPAMNNWRTKWLLSQNHERIPLTSLSENNVVLVDESGVRNPKEKFQDQEFNWEYFGHEMIDKLFPWAYLEMVLGVNLLGTWTCSAVSHAQELEFLKVLHQTLIQQEAARVNARQSLARGLGSPSAPLVER